MCGDLIRKFTKRILQQVFELLLVEFCHACLQGSRRTKHIKRPLERTQSRSLQQEVGERSGHVACARWRTTRQSRAPRHPTVGQSVAHQNFVVRGEFIANMLSIGDETAAMTRADQKFLDECLKVKREREWHNPAPPRSPAWSLPKPSPSQRGEEALNRPRFGGPPFRLELHHLDSDSRSKTLHSPSGLRWRSEHGGEDGIFLAVAELMRATAAVQARESEVAERVNKLELKMPSSSKVASEFQRMW